MPCNQFFKPEYNEFRQIKLKGFPILLYVVDINNVKLQEFLLDDFNFEISLRLLNLKDRMRVLRCRRKEDQAKRLTIFLMNKFVLNGLLHRHGNSHTFDPWKDINFTYNEYGKPSIYDEKDVEFLYSASSSNEISCIAVQLNSKEPIGVDLSHSHQAVSQTNFLEEFDLALHEKEKKQLLDVESVLLRYIAFNQLWTLKEAFTKFVGCGLNIDLSSFYFEFEKVELDELTCFSISKSSEDLKWLKRTKVLLDINKKEKILEDFMDDTKDIRCSSAIIDSQKGFTPIIASVISHHDAEIHVFEIKLGEILPFFFSELYR